MQKLFFVSCLLSVQYVLNLYSNLLEWRKNPQWSFSCCLALLLPLKDLQEDFGGLDATNVLTSQLQSGDFDVPTILAGVKQSGVIDTTLEESGQGDDSTEETHGSFHVEYRNKHRQQGTQTEPLSLSIARTVAHEQTKVAL